MQGENIFYLCCSIIVRSVHVEDIAIELIEQDAPEKPIEIVRANNQRHAGGYRLVLNEWDFHCSAQQTPFS
jgi:hypothetical protein